MQMLRCLHTRHGEVEDVVGDAADAAPEQMNISLCAEEQYMNSLTPSKTEVLEKIEESL